MPVPAALRRLTEDPAFWTGARGPAAELRVPFPVAAGYALVLDLGPDDRALGLRTPAAADPVPLGYAPAGGPYPAVLRWWELELCARVIALADPTLPHPGLVVALLGTFAPATADDDADQVCAVRRAAYASLRRDVPPAPEPEQDPLPLFTGPAWWPVPDPRVLDDAAVAALAGAGSAAHEVRGAARFPGDLLADLLRGAARRLDRHRAGAWPGALPLAEHIAGTGDLGGVPALLGLLTEAGCDHPTVLDALSEPLVTAEACWMVETLAGAAPGTLLRRHVRPAAL